MATVEAEIGRIGVLVNNAANDERHDVDSVTPEYWDQAFAVNLRHQFFAAQAVRPHMKGLGFGSIVNFSSIAWMAGGAGFVAYATAKAAVVGLTNSLAREFGSDNIRVNAIAPGAVVHRAAASPLVHREAGGRVRRAADDQAAAACPTRSRAPPSSSPPTTAA